MISLRSGTSKKNGMVNSLYKVYEYSHSVCIEKMRPVCMKNHTVGKVASMKNHTV